MLTDLSSGFGSKKSVLDSRPLSVPLLYHSLETVLGPIVTPMVGAKASPKGKDSRRLTRATTCCIPTVFFVCLLLLCLLLVQYYYMLPSSIKKALRPPLPSQQALDLLYSASLFIRQLPIVVTSSYGLQLGAVLQSSVTLPLYFCAISNMQTLKSQQVLLILRVRLI